MLNSRMRGFLYLDFKIEIYIHDKWNAIAKIYQYILNDLETM